ncbi:MAG: pilus assembly protein PilO [Candidatus Dadabacteria bacterium]|nr:MAG: pilus assembly protein PilO [Candidatus Dadabacteria bacterium]
MMAFIEDVLDRPLGQKLIIWAVSALLVSLLLWAQMYSPKLQKYSDIEEKILSLKTQLLKERKLAMNLDRYKEEVKKLDIKLQFALQELPDKSEIPELLSSISGLAKDSGLEVGLFKVNAEELDEFYARVPVEISVTGTYHQIASFFDQVGNLPRIVNIGNIQLSKPVKKSDGYHLQANLVATTFRYITPEEQKQRKELEKRRRKRRR